MIIDLLSDLMIKRKLDVDDWFISEFNEVTPIFYNSVDIRNAGFKIAPVDSNIFPAGFNNLSAKGIELAKQKIDEYFLKYYPYEIKNIVIIPENHTRNLSYLENLLSLKEILEHKERNIHFASIYFDEDIVHLEIGDGRQITIEKYHQHNNSLILKSGFKPDLIILNNDLTGGVLKGLEGISQDILPSIKLGWYVRKKSSHFDIYQEIVEKFCRSFNIDTFLIEAVFAKCGFVNFKDKKGIDCVATKVDLVISNLREEYKKRGIKEDPYVYVKADRGTYGMGVMTVRSGEEIYNINKKTRNKMDIIKGGMVNTEVIIQEGIKTIDKVGENPAEAMVYLIGNEVINISSRYNVEKDDYANLNSTGMAFENMINENSKNYMAYSLIAKLTNLASSMEKY